MKAIEAFLEGDLPVDNYVFIFYIKDHTEFEGLFTGQEIKIGTIIKAIRTLAGKGFGALEHGNSSVYYLPDFGGTTVLDGMADVCIHEFFHILTPLGLHSEEIGNFNYIDPKMSQHLWLYEGITEYFAGISQLKGEVIDEETYVRNLLRGKIRAADRYPTKKMSFTEMSANVLRNPYKKQYAQVYQTGALMGALLDIRIMELTQGQKDLHDVILALRDTYGPENSFKDDAIIGEFVDLVHPDLQQFFDDYVTGREELPIKAYLDKVGIAYDRRFEGSVVMDPLRDVGYKIRNVRGADYVEIKKVTKENPYQLVEGDRVVRYSKELDNVYGGQAEGTALLLEVTRGDSSFSIPYEVQYKAGTKKYFIRFHSNPTAEQLALRNLWFQN
jgi:predicted metalloprotease with PDZ domain